MDYDFSRLSSREFEQMVQALAVEAISPGIAIFGDGPDGGREATFEGRALYPTAATGWDGYLVLQAKFRQRPDRRTNGTWLQHQLSEELRRYKDGGRRRPDYMVFATNVVLTPARGGGKDRVVPDLKRLMAEIGVRDAEIWDYEKLRALLDGNEAVRHAYGAWITPGDVLKVAMTHLKDNGPDFEQTIAAFLLKELLADQYVNLEQAGHATEDKIPLGRVFVDLPAHFEERGERPERCVARLLELCGHKLSPGSAPGVGGPTGRVVLVGGPGQGKSTLGQFLCQLHRVALLRERDSATIAADAGWALESILACAERDDLRLPRARRFPLRVPLSSYAAALATPNGPAGLLEHLVDRVNRRTRAGLSVPQFRAWLAQYPWLIVLDGLDEVPATSNRDQVLASIADFWVDAALAESDVFVVATTRPQGYSADFSPRLYEHVRLGALSATDALRYGELLAEERYGRDSDRQQRVTRRLQRAATTDATQRLMQTPLQVTIMTALVDSMGQPPQERWSLFSTYYEVIYQREREREIPAAAILRDHRADVDAIHQRVALLLQLKSERVRQTDARLSHVQLAEIVEQRLREEGHDEARVAELREQILEAAGERLVFLVGLEDDRVGFEIRSLQEFMAGECLMDGTDENVRERLTAVAGTASWRNVFLFAAGKCFARHEHLRDTLLRICVELNEGEDGLARVCSAGSILAADLLLDGPANSRPRYQRLLGREMIRAFGSAPCRSHERMADVYKEVPEQWYCDDLAQRIADSDAIDVLVGWQTVLMLAAQDVPWATELERRHWPPNAAEIVVGLLDSGSIEALSSHARGRLLNDVPCQLSFGTVCNHAVELARLLHIRRPPAWLELAAKAANAGSGDLQLPTGPLEDGVPWRMTVTGVARPRPGTRLRDVDELHASWTPLGVAARFEEQPRAAELAAGLRLIAERCEPDDWRMALDAPLPWPVAACLMFAEDADGLRALAAAAASGSLGDREDWIRAERRWMQSGVTPGDYLHTAFAAELPFDEQIAEVGAPLLDAEWSFSAKKLPSVSSTLRRAFYETQHGRVRAIIGKALVRLSRVSPGGDQAATLAEVAEWLGDDPTGIDLRWVARLVEDEPPTVGFDELDRLGTHPVIQSNSEAGTLSSFSQRLAAGLEARPERTGLWLLLAHAMPSLPPTSAQQLAHSMTRLPWPSDLRARAAAAVVRLYMQEEAEVSMTASAIAEAAAQHPRTVSRLLASTRGCVSTIVYQSVLVLLLEQRVRRGDVPLRLQLAALGDDVLRRRRSPLQQRERWDELGLFARNERVFEAPAPR